MSSLSSRHPAKLNLQILELKLVETIQTKPTISFKILTTECYAAEIQFNLINLWEHLKSDFKDRLKTSQAVLIAHRSKAPSETRFFLLLISIIFGVIGVLNLAEI